MGSALRSTRSNCARMYHTLLHTNRDTTSFSSMSADIDTSSTLNACAGAPRKLNVNLQGAK